MGRRQCRGIKHLRKDFLQYELAIRRLPTEGAVPELTKRLRAGLDMPVAVSPEIIGDVAAASQNIIIDLFELERNVSLFEVNHPTSTQFDRVRAQLTHLKNHLSDLKCLELDNALSQSVDELIDCASILQIRAVSIRHFSLWLHSEKESTESDGLGPRPGSTEVCTNDSHSSFPQYSHFAKLPDSISCLLNGITELSASSVNCIQHFLWLLVRFEQLTIELQIPHNVALSLLLPLAVGDLRSLLSDALAEGFSIELFRQIVIARKLSPCMRNELEKHFFWRVQGPQESLNEYVERIWTVVLAIVINISEGEIISHILQGMRPDYQSRLTLFDRPSTVEELELVVESLEALAIADSQRQEV